MKLGEDLQKKLRKNFEPSATVNMRYKGNDVLLKTDPQGNGMQLFIGKMDNHGIVRGHRFCRILKFDKNGSVIKDHWDLKGKSK